VRAPWIVVFAASLVFAPGALANGDPASDVLLQAKIYFPTQRVGVPQAQQLHRVVQAANTKGYTIRVALIHDENDLGTVPNLLNQPQKYAEFLGPEIRFAYRGDLLVVMPDGVGLASTDQTPPPAQAIAGMKVEAGGSPDGLAQTAVEAVTALAKAAGHPLSGGAKKGGGGGALVGIVVAVALVVLGIGAAFWARRSAPRPGAPPPAAP
jgi:hypothetical protein